MLVEGLVAAVLASFGVGVGRSNEWRANLSKIALEENDWWCKSIARVELKKVSVPQAKKESPEGMKRDRR